MREAEQVHHREGRDHRQRQRRGRDQRGAPVAQEQPHHQHRQQRAFVQQRHRAVVVLLHRVDEVEGLGDGDVRVRGLQLVERGAHARGDLDLAGAAAARDLEADHRLAVEQRGRALLGHGVAARAPPGPGGCAGRRRARSPCAPARRPTARWRWCAPTARRRRGRCGRPRLPAAPGAAGARCRRRWRSAPAACSGSSSTRTSRVDAADARHRADAAHAEHGLGDVCCRRTSDSASSSMRLGGDGVGQDRHAGQLHLGDDRVAQVAGQVGAHARRPRRARRPPLPAWASPAGTRP